MKQWYFDIKTFKPEVGFDCGFYEGTEEKQWLHLCKIVEVIPQRKLSYAGDMMVTKAIQNVLLITHLLFPYPIPSRFTP
jgi:hypothetical protein